MSNGRYPPYADPEDMFADTRMSFGDHLEELRTHLWRAVKGFALAMALALCVGNYVVEFIAAPVERQLKVFNERVGARKAADMRTAAQSGNLEVASRPMKIWVNKNEMRALAGQPPQPEPLLGNVLHAYENLLEQYDAAHLIDRQHLAHETGWAAIRIEINDPRFDAEIIKTSLANGNTLKTFNVTEAFMVYFKVSLVTGLIIGSPWIFYQIWAFVAAGLYPHEKKYVNYYLPFSIGLFLAGAAVCQFLVIPKAIEVLLSFNEWMGLEPDLRLNEWLSFAMTMPLIFGISFQTPLVMLFIYKIGIVDVASFRAHRKIAWFLMAIFAAIITPTVDALSMLFLWVPMGFLYELGILLCAFQPNTPFEAVETPESEEMVEV